MGIAMSLYPNHIIPTPLDTPHLLSQYIPMNKRGRPRKEPTVRVRVPVSLLDAFRVWLKAKQKDGKKYGNES